MSVTEPMEAASLRTCITCRKKKPMGEYRLVNRKSGSSYFLGKCNDCQREYGRSLYYKNHDERKRENRERSARKRAEDPVPGQIRYRLWQRSNRERENAGNRAYLNRRFFWTKAKKLDQPGRATPAELGRLWKRQRGICALTGHRLDRSAHLDHKRPKIRGGSDDISNLQWLRSEVNYAKRDLTNEEFIRFCQDVLDWNSTREAMRKIAQLDKAA